MVWWCNDGEQIKWRSLAILSSGLLFVMYYYPKVMMSWLISERKKERKALKWQTNQNEVIGNFLHLPIKITPQNSTKRKTSKWLENNNEIIDLIRKSWFV